MGRRTKKAVTLTLKKKPKSPERPLCQNSLGSYCDDYDDDVEDGGQCEDADGDVGGGDDAAHDSKVLNSGVFVRYVVVC